MLPFVAKLQKHNAAANTLGITLFDYQSYISSEEDVLLMIHTAEGFANKNHKPATFRANYL